MERHTAGEHMMQFLQFVPLAFVIAPVIAVERSSGMDSLILSSRNGWRKIGAAKLLSVLVASIVVVGFTGGRKAEQLHNNYS